jgi:hypothetical protein
MSGPATCPNNPNNVTSNSKGQNKKGDLLHGTGMPWEEGKEAHLQVTDRV